MTNQTTNGHLTENAISRWLVEGPWREAEEHVRICRGCQASLAEAQEPLIAFRSTLLAWSEARSARIGSTAKVFEFPSRLNFMNWLPAFGVALAVAVLAAFLVGSPASHWHHALQQQAKAPQVSDSALMDQVDEEVSEAVPDAMAPLTDLVAWDSGDNASTVVGGERAGTGKRTVKEKSAMAKKAKPGVSD
jgi:hypothetical protein